MKKHLETALFIALQPVVLIGFGLFVKDGWVVTEMMGIAYLLSGLVFAIIFGLDRLGFMPPKE